jgi:hypothetical protein
MNHTNYGKRVIERLSAALAADEKRLKRQRFENGIWSIRHYEERWLQFLLLQKTVGRQDFALATEDTPFKDGQRVDLAVYDGGSKEEEKLVAAIELKGPWNLEKGPPHLLKQARTVLKLQDERVKECGDLWVAFLVHALEHKIINDWVRAVSAIPLAQGKAIVEYQRNVQLNPDSPKKVEKDRSPSTTLSIVGMRVGH